MVNANALRFMRRLPKAREELRGSGSEELRLAPGEPAKSREDQPPQQLSPPLPQEPQESAGEPAGHCAGMTQKYVQRS